MKKICALLFTAVIVFAFTACSYFGSYELSSSNINHETTTNEPAPDEFKPLEIKDSGHVVSDGYLYYTVILHNPNEKLAVEYPSFRITARDENDQVIGTEEQVLSIIYPQQDFVYAFLAFETDKQPAKVDIEALEPRDYNIVSAEMLDNPEYIPLEIVGANLNGNSVLGEVSNLNDYDIESAVVTVIFKDADGKITGGDSTFINKVAAGGKTPFDLSIDSDLITDDYDVYANNW